MSATAIMSEYDKQAADFLKATGTAIKVTFVGGKCPPWDDNQCMHGDNYRVTLSNSGRRMSFEFWGSFADMREGKRPTAYDVLACIGSDAYAPETFEDFCDEYGYDPDSRKSERLFKRVNRFAKRLRAFFDAEELAALSEIR